MKNVVSYDDMLAAKKGIIMGNVGHFNNEIDYASLEKKNIGKTVKSCTEAALSLHRFQ